MKFRSLILFAAAAVLLLSLVIIGILYFPVNIPAVAVPPDPITLSYRAYETSPREFEITRDDPEYALIAGLLANPGKARFFDPVPYIGMIVIQTLDLHISFVGDSLIHFDYREDTQSNWNSSTRKLTPQDHEILLRLRARCEKEADKKRVPVWIR